MSFKTVDFGFLIESTGYVLDESGTRLTFEAWRALSNIVSSASTVQGFDSLKAHGYDESLAKTKTIQLDNSDRIILDKVIEESTCLNCNQITQLMSNRIKAVLRLTLIEAFRDV
jgi:hypothetical protein